MNRMPTSLIFFVTGRCNSRCQHCFYWKNLNKGRNELSMKEIDAFSRQLGRLNDVSLSGGEPFLRNDIVSIYETFVKNNHVKNFGIPTNGLLPETIEARTRDMLALNHNTKLLITISIDGNQPLHDEIRGVAGSYKKAVETYQRLNGLRSSYSRLSLKVSTTISNKNIKHLEEIMLSVGRDMPGIDFHNFELIRGSPKNKSYSVPSAEEMRGARKQIFSYWSTFRFFSGSRLKSRVALNVKKMLFDINLKTITEHRQIIRCRAYEIYCVLDEVGNLYFCELLPAIGNIRNATETKGLRHVVRPESYRQNTLKEIWNSDAANKQRESIENGKCWCTHSCFQQKNIINSKKLYPRIILGY